MKYLDLPTKKELEKYFDWDETGSLRWKVNVGHCKIGQEAGYREPRGYWCVKINQTSYYKHRILFSLYHNKNNFRTKKIDHIDGNKSNNAKNNLRIEHKHFKNEFNSKTRTNNTSGCKGVSFEKSSAKWKAYITFARQTIILGYYQSFIYACVVRRRAAKLYHGDWRRD